MINHKSSALNVSTVLAGIACLAVSAGASLAASAPVTISGPSPFAGCFVLNEPGTNYLNAEVEPWLSTNPADVNNLIAGWQQDRWSNGGSRSLMSAFSNDGGASWQRVVVPGLDKCSGGVGEFSYDRATDPWLAISPNGAAYFFSLSFNNDRPDGGGGINAMMVSKSTNGGASWGAPQVLIRDTDGKAFNDKNSITADPTDSRYVYAVWDRLFDTSLPSKIIHGDGAANARKWHKEAVTRGGASPSFFYFTGAAYLARTINGGQSWEPAKEIYNPGINSQTIANQVVVLNDGSVMDFYMEILHSGQTNIGYVKSGDHGATFGKPVNAVNANVTLNGTATPDAKEPVRDANVLFDVAIDRGNGNLYLVWQDGRQGGVDRVGFSMSPDNGVHWSKPVIINKTPASANPLKNQAFIPSVEVGANHKVYVTYYDFRNDGAYGELSDYWAITCSANCTIPANWGNEQRLTPTSFDMLNAPVARGHFLGDYMGLERQGNAVRALFGVAIAPNENEMVTSVIP